MHGAPKLKPDQVQTFSSEAVQIALEALRAVFTTHDYLLAINTSEDRSVHLLHDSKPGAETL